MSSDFIFRGPVVDVDPGLKTLLDLEDGRQDATIILIASESASPDAVREVMGSSFGNVYAEGYPREASRKQSEQEILDTEMELALYRRYSDPRYYKGVEYANVLEALTRRRAAELFAANGVHAEELYINVQPLSGAPANSAVYTALLQPGDTIMGLNLNDGGHLSHGSRVNRSGKVYNTAPYFVDPETELLDYDAIEAHALEVNPQIIVAGYSAYPRIVDWQRFREIADACGAYLLADIAHISGLVASGVHPSPIGIADVVTTTTHKSLCGPRGAMLMTHRKDLFRRFDRAVFPGEQGGPHLNTMAALAVALKLAKTEQFLALQERIVENASRLADKLSEKGIRIVGGGSDNHLLLIDTKSVTHNGVHLSGDMAARVLDVVGIVLNRNTIPGDKGALNPTGLRLGTVWISQLGFGEPEIDLLAEAIADVLQGCKPYTYQGRGKKKLYRTKVSYQALQRGRDIVRQLRGRSRPNPAGQDVLVRGIEAATFLNHALTSDVLALNDGESQPTHIYGDGLDAGAVVKRESAESFTIHFAGAETAQDAADWLAALSDAYVEFDDLYGKLSGPVVAKTITGGLDSETMTGDPIVSSKPYFIGQEKHLGTEALPAFAWQEPAEAPMKRTTLYDTHKAMGAKIIPFGGYEMPVWYTSVGEEHAAVRETAGLFDATHMGVFEVSGPYAMEFLETVTTNDVSTLKIGQSHYTYLLLPNGSVVDDLMVYRRGQANYMMVVNASNNDKDWAWLNAVNQGEVLIDDQRPFANLQHPAVLRDLRDLEHGDDCRVDVPLQGPKSTEILLALVEDAEFAAQIKSLPWAGLVEGKVAGLDAIVSRTGYTGERTAYELFVHPQHAPILWTRLVEVGEPLGLKNCGLAARDSTRTEAGLPLYGHELAGDMALNPADAGFGSYVKLWKPFFVGRTAFIAHENERTHAIVRFRMNDRAVRRPDTGDPVMDKRGKVIGEVTSCAIDRDGFLLGQAAVPLEMAKAETPLFIYQLGGGKRTIRTPREIKAGARLPMPDSSTVLTRFPSRKKGVKK